MKNLKVFFLLYIIINISFASETGSKCIISEDCPELHDCVDKVCVHKTLFPITFREVGGTIYVALLNALITAAGMGAGAAYVPYIMLIFEHTIKKSIGIGYACVFGGGIGNLANILRLKNPKTNRYMTNFNINMIILPTLMIGVFVGVLLNRILPPLVTNIILLLIIGYSLIKNYFKIKANIAKERKLRQQEKQAQAQAQALAQVQGQNHLQDHPIPEKESILHHEVEEIKFLNIEKNPIAEKISLELFAVACPKNLEAHLEGKAVPNISKQASDTKSPCGEENLDKFSPEPASSLNHIENFAIHMESFATHITHFDNEIKIDHVVTSNKNEQIIKAKLEKILKREQRFPCDKLLHLLSNVAIIIVIGLIRGTKKFEPVVGVEWTCGWDFLWFALGILAFSINSVISVYLVNKWQKEKIEVGFEFLPEDPLLTKTIIFKIMVRSGIAGILGALVALGGALIVAPLLLDLGIPPLFTAATTGVFMIFTMFNAMFTTILDGKLTWQELIWFIGICIVFSYLSSKIVNWYIKKTGRQSTIILLVMFVTTLGFLCVLVVCIKGMVENYKGQTTFTPLC